MRIWWKRLMESGGWSAMLFSEPVAFEGTDTLLLRIEADRRTYRFYAGTDGAEYILIGTGSTQLLSTECMNGTFTGCFAGMFAEGECRAHFASFKTEG